MSLRPGMSHRATYTVRPAHTVPELVRDVVEGTELAEGEPVLASGFLLALIEDVCWALVRPALRPEQARLGVVFDGMRHCGPALVGDRVEIEATCRSWDTARGAGEFSVRARNLRTGLLVAEIERHGLSLVDRQRWRSKHGISEKVLA